MKRSRFLTAVVLMLLATVGFISLPAYSGENPWDADSGHQTEVDTTWVNPDVLASLGRQTVSPDSDWYNGLLVQVSLFVLDTYTDLFGPKSVVTQVEVYKAKVR